MRELTGFFAQRPRSTDHDTWKTEDTARWEIPCHDVAWKDLPMGKPKTRMCEVWTLHFFKVPPLTASYSFYICGRMPRGSLSMMLILFGEWCCDIRWCMMWFLYVKKGDLFWQKWGDDQESIESKAQLSLSPRAGWRKGVFLYSPAKPSGLEAVKGVQRRPLKPLPCPQIGCAS